MKLQIGSLDVGLANTVRVIDGTVPILQNGIESLFQAHHTSALAEIAGAIEEVVIGYSDLRNTYFVESFPNVTSVRILPLPNIDLQGLQAVPKVKHLSVDARAVNWNVIGGLHLLEQLYIGEWSNQASVLANCAKLRDLKVRKYPYKDLALISSLSSLESLWLAYGGLTNPKDLPSHVRSLELNQLRNFESLKPLSESTDIERLILLSCPKLTKLDGIEHLYKLATLSVASKTYIDTLEPLRDLQRLEYLALAGGVRLNHADITAIYSLSNLRTLIISKTSGIDVNRLKTIAPRCEVNLTA